VRLPESLFAARTMQALELVALHPMSAPQVADALQVHPRTARRLLTRLADDGWLTRSEDARRVYAPTMRVVSLAGHVLERCRVAEAAGPFVDDLHAELGTPAHLMVPSYRWVLCVVHGEGPPARPALRELAPCHATATGKALLAHRDAWRESVLGAPLERLTAATMTDPAVLRRDGDDVRQRGYATEDGEWRAGVRAVAAPVFGAAGDAVAALGAAVPEGAGFERAGELVAGSARELSARTATGAAHA
jgi:DNA-binding IclR family transcriptional regulator